MEEEKRPQDISSVDKQKRIFDVYTLMLQGANRQQIIQYCSEKYKVTERATDYYIEDARKLMKENFLKTDDANFMKSEIYARLESLYQQNIEIDDLKECRNILKDIRDMLGLNEATKTNLVVTNTVTPEQAKKIANELDNDY
jgi:hypothetical protein